MTALVYGVPKLARGGSSDDQPTDEVKADQKEFFRLLYHLLVDAERGPRLPTLIVALGRRAGAERWGLGASRWVSNDHLPPPHPPPYPSLSASPPPPFTLSPNPLSPPASSASYAAGLESRRNSEQRCHSASSPMARAAEGEQRQAAQEAAVGLVLPGHGAVALPAVAAQQVEAAVVAHAAVGVDRHVVGILLPAPGRRAPPKQPATPGAGGRRQRAWPAGQLGVRGVGQGGGCRAAGGPSGRRDSWDSSCLSEESMSVPGC